MYKKIEKVYSEIVKRYVNKQKQGDGTFHLDLTEKVAEK
jgi:hypothetical protein